MKSLIPLFKKVEEIQQLLGQDVPALPHVVLVGAQGSGKSSVIENLLGHSCYPNGLQTRCPVIINLRHNEENFITVHFSHIPKNKYTEWKEVHEELKNEMERLAEEKSGISSKPISLEIKGRQMIDMTLIDLPGLMAVATGEPVDISMQLKKLAMCYMRSSESIILAVCSATTDVVTNECLVLSRVVDPTGARTIVVITKVDLAEPGENLTNILTGKKTPGFPYIVGVICRSMKGSKEKKKIDDILKRERKLLHECYPRLSRDHGTAVLQVMITQLLTEHIYLMLPELKQAVIDATYKVEGCMAALGAEHPDPHKVILEEVTKYATAYSAILGGNTTTVDLHSVVGGARICYIFCDVFAKDLDSLDALSNLSRTQILTALRNTCGTRPEVLFIPETCFENLARRQIVMLTAPCKRCVELVYEEMIRLTQDCLNCLMPERYPRLYDFMYTVTAELIERRHCASAQLVDELLDMELGYVNTLDPDFQRDLDSVKLTWLRTRGLHPPLPTDQPRDEMTNDREVPRSHWLSSLLSRREGLECTPTAPPLPSLVQEVGIIRMSLKEDADCLLVESLIVSYVTAVRRSLKDAVPKAIMLRMINYVQANLYHTLLERLQEQKGNEEYLVQEPDTILAERKYLTTSFTQLKNALGALLMLQDDLRKKLSM